MLFCSDMKGGNADLCPWGGGGGEMGRQGRAYYVVLTVEAKVGAAKREPVVPFSERGGERKIQRGGSDDG